MRLKLTMAVLFFFGVLPASPQVVPAATEGRSLPLAIGAGYSSFDVDWGHGRMGGGTIWVDWHLYTREQALRGISVEFEGRDISQGGSITQPNLRQDTGLVGLNYTLPHFQKLHPYAKFMMGLGSEDFISGDPYYKHDTRTVTAYGGGLEYRIIPHVWAKADYEYQRWSMLLNGTPDPQGFTVGVMYDFSRGFSRAH